MTAPIPPGASVNPLLLGGVLLFAGFTAGFFAGRESLRHEGAGAPRSGPHASFESGAPAMSGGAGGGESMPPAMLPARTGHTFTGEINAPPHGEEGHDLAQTLLAGATCPCGGCQHMLVLECGCDMSREIEGLAAHLLERGKPRHEVAAQLQQHFGLVLASAPAARPPSGPDALDGLADALSKPGVGGPAQVPTGARKTAPGP